MSNKWAVQNGNWSDSGTWNDGVVPTVDDDVWLNGYTVTLNTSNPIVANSITNALCEITLRDGGLLTRTAVYLTINADLVGNGTTLFNASAGGQGFIINGNCHQQENGQFLITNAQVLYQQDNIFINGNCEGNVLLARVFTHYTAAASGTKIFINGNINGNISMQQQSTAGNPYTAYIGCVCNGNFSLVGGRFEFPAMITQIIGDFIDNGNIVYAPTGVIKFGGNTTLKRFPVVFDLLSENKLEIDTSNIHLINYSNYPSESDVKINVEYGINNEYTGTYSPNLPQESTVLKDVEYGDNQVGTLEVIALSGATAQADQIAVVNLTEQEVNRVKNCATIQTVQQCFEDFKDE